MDKNITVETVVDAAPETLWKVWNDPARIQTWAFASDDWHCPKASNDLRIGGRFSTTMAAKDGSMSFDITGTYTAVEPLKAISYTMDGDDARKVSILFKEVAGGTKVVETFEMESENPREMQRAGWQSILDNFKKAAESYQP